MQRVVQSNPCPQEGERFYHSAIRAGGCRAARTPVTARAVTARAGAGAGGRGAGAETVQGTESHSTQPPL